MASQLLTTQRCSASATGTTIWFDISALSAFTVQAIPTSDVLGTVQLTLTRANYTKGLSPAAGFPLEIPTIITTTDTTGAMSNALSCNGFLWLGVTPTGTTSSGGKIDLYVAGKY